MTRQLLRVESVTEMGLIGIVSDERDPRLSAQITPERVRVVPAFVRPTTLDAMAQRIAAGHDTFTWFDSDDIQEWL